MTYTIDNPRFLPGNISGRGMENTENGRVVDTRFAVEIDFIDGCLIEYPTAGHPMYALALAGTIGGTSERARCVYLLAAEGAGVLIERIVSLAGMIGPEFTQSLLERVDRLHRATPPAHEPRAEAIPNVDSETGIQDPKTPFDLRVA